MKIGVLAFDDPDNIRTWSGVPHFMTRQLRERVGETVYLRTDPPPTLGRDVLLNRVSRRLLNRQIAPEHTVAAAKHHARQLQLAIDREKPDLIFAITVDQQLAYLETDVPIVHHSDTTFAGVVDYYPKYSRLWPGVERNLHDQCRRVIQRSAVSTYPSRWAADSAVRDYDADPAAVHVIAYGANLKQPPPRAQATNIDARQTCQLLFISVDWRRKGGDIAFDAMVELNRRGIDASLVVVGCNPPHEHDKLVVHPFLNKQIPEQLAIYQSLWRTSAFLCHPTRAESFGAIYGEAAACGMPAVTSDTGGLADAVAHQHSGWLLPLDAKGGDYADVIEQLWSDRSRYEQMVHGARDRYETVLNWDVWGQRTADVIHDMMSKRSRP